MPVVKIKHISTVDCNHTNYINFRNTLEASEKNTRSADANWKVVEVINNNKDLFVITPAEYTAILTKAGTGTATPVSILDAYRTVIKLNFQKSHARSSTVSPTQQIVDKFDVAIDALCTVNGLGIDIDPSSISYLNPANQHFQDFIRFIRKQVQKKLRIERQDEWLNILIRETFKKLELLNKKGYLKSEPNQYIIVTLPEFYFTEYNYFDKQVKPRPVDSSKVHDINYHKPFYIEAATKLPGKIHAAFGNGAPLNGRTDILIVAGTIVSKVNKPTMEYLYNTMCVVSSNGTEHTWNKVYTSPIDGLNIYNKSDHKTARSGDITKNTNLPFFTWKGINFGTQICLDFSQTVFNTTLMEHLLDVETKRTTEVNQWINKYTKVPIKTPHIGILVAAGMPLSDIDRIKTNFSQTFLRCDLLKFYNPDTNFRTYNPSIPGGEFEKWCQTPCKTEEIFYVYEPVSITI